VSAPVSYVLTSARALRIYLAGVHLLAVHLLAMHLLAVHLLAMHLLAMHLLAVLLKRLAQVHRSLLELIEYQLPYKKAWASAFFVDHDTTTVEQSYESHMGTQYCNLRTRGSSRLQ
jgi:hypothetical protein